MKIGVVGYGSIGQRHAANIEKLGHSAVVYDPASRRDVKLERMIYDSDVQGVVIATPSPYHEGPLRACIERRKHALVEKPISTVLGALPELLRVADENKLVIMMGNNLRFHACVREARAWLAAGYIGKPIWAQFTCATLTEKPLYRSDGVTLNTGSHEVDMAMHLLGPATVLVASARHDGTTDDISDFVLDHGNGVRSSFHLDFVTDQEIREFRITGEDGNIFCHLPLRFMVRRQANPKLPSVNHTDTFFAPGSYAEDYLDEMRAFIDAIEGKELIGATGQDGLGTLQVLLDIRRKAVNESCRHHSSPHGLNPPAR